MSIWLRAPEPLLWERVRHKSTRPLLQTDDPRATLQELIAAREPHYAEAGLVVDAEDGLAISEMAAKVAGVLAKERPDVLEIHDA